MRTKKKGGLKGCRAYWRRAGIEPASGGLTSAAAVGSVHPGFESTTPVSGTICRTFPTSRESAPSPWAKTNPWGTGPAPWGTEAKARPRLDSTLGPHGPCQGPPCPLLGEVPSLSFSFQQHPRGQPGPSGSASLGDVALADSDSSLA